MKFGANTFIWTDSFGPEHFGILPRLKEAGLDGIEIGMLSPTTFRSTEFRRELEKNKLGCTTCAILPHGTSLISEDKEERRKARVHVEECLKVTADAGGTVVCGPLYSPVGFFTGARRTNDDWKRAVESWQELAPVAAKTGVAVAIEPLNRFETYFLNTAADAAQLCAEVGHPSVGILFDTFHANIEEKHVGHALRHAAKYVKHLHSCENDRGIPGTVHVNWPEFFSAVRDIGYDGWMVIESF